MITLTTPGGVYTLDVSVGGVILAVVALLVVGAVAEQFARRK